MGSYMGHEYADAPAPAEQVQGRYRVGDRVRITNSANPEWWFKSSQFGVVARDERGDGLFKYEVNLDDGGFNNPAFVDDIHITPAFAPGERVRLNKHRDLHACGDRGTVKRVFGDNVEVKMDLSVYGSRSYVFPAEHLDWVRDEPAPDCAERKVEQDNEPAAGGPAASGPKFKAGDVVTYKTDKTVRRTISRYKKMYGRYAYEYVDGGFDYEKSLELAPCPQDNERSGDQFMQSIVSGFLSSLSQEQPCIVARVNKFGTTPHVHPDVATATTEAERLARNNPGWEFAVYQRVAGRQCAVSYEMKEVA